MPPSRFMKLCDGVDGRWLTFALDQYITPSISLLGEYSPEEVALCTQYLQDRDEVVVVGANIGGVAVPLARHVWPGRVTCFEPQRLMAMALAANALLHGCDNIHIRQTAVGESHDELRFTPADPRQHANTGGVEVGSAGSTTVQVVPLDQAEFGTPKLLHIDAEGMEPSVLRGARQLIRRAKPVLVVEIDRPQVREETIALVRELGYTRLLEHHPPLIGNYVSINLVALPDGVPAPTVGHLHAV